MKKLLLIDGHNFLFRSFSIPFKFYSKNKTPLHVITTFLKAIRRSLDAIGESDEINIIIVFDTETITSNHELSDTYKANRKKDYSEDEDHPFIHLPLIKKTLDYLEIKQIEIQNVEADDVIATLSKKFLDLNKDGHVYIASHDTDFYQLLKKNVAIIKHLKKGENIVIDESSVKTILGINPNEYVYFKSLTGDSADNIAGVPGVGPIRAKKIVNKEIEIDLTKYKDILEMNLKLIKLNDDVKLDLNINKLHVNSKINMSNKEIFINCGF